MRFWLYFPLWIFFGDEVINLSLSLGSSPSAPLAGKPTLAVLSLLVHILTPGTRHCVCVCVCVCVCARACTHACTLSHIWYFVTPLAVACQTPLSMEFSRQEYWNKWSFPSPVDHPNPGIKPTLLCLLLWQAGSLPAEPQGSPCKRQWLHLNMWAQSDLTASRSSYDAETSLICMRTVLYKIPRKKYFPYSCTSFVWGALVISGPWTAPTNLDYSAYSDHVWVT